MQIFVFVTDIYNKKRNEGKNGIKLIIIFNSLVSYYVIKFTRQKQDQTMIGIESDVY